MATDDTVITTQTKMALAADERAGMLDIEVETIDGVVYLRGQVETEADRAAAASVAARVEGVRMVCNELSVMEVKTPTSETVALPEHRPFAGEENEQQ